MRKLLLAGMIVFTASSAFAWDPDSPEPKQICLNGCPQVDNPDWQQRSQDAVRVIPGGIAPAPGTMMSVNAAEYCSYYSCNGRDWWTLYGYGIAHWDSNSPTMKDAPELVKATAA